jgi:hypothetical protein
MPYAFRFYRFASASAFLAAWAEAGQPMEGDEPQLPGGALDVIGAPPPPGAPEEGAAPPPPAPAGWYVNAAWPGEEPPSLAAFHIPAAEALRVFAGWDGSGPPAPVPASVTNFQARAALMQMPGPGGTSLFEAINAALLAGRDASPEGKFRWQAWEQANDFTRNGPTVNALAESFGVSQAELDTLFRAAAAVEA